MVMTSDVDNHYYNKHARHVENMSKYIVTIWYK